MSEVIEHLGRIDIYVLDQILRGRIVPGQRILDAGCGGGRNITYLLREGYDVSAVDRSADAVERVRTLASELAPDIPAEQYQVAAVEALPFEEDEFDVVISCAVLHFAESETHFASMLTEMARVLRPGGLLALNVWDSFEHNQVAGVARETIAGFFETDPPDFLTVPFGFHEIEPIRTLAGDAGFIDAEVSKVPAIVERPDAVSIARGFVEGNPGILQIRERAEVDAETIIAALAAKIEDLYGPAPLLVPLQEIVGLARKP